jgi:hypothetical protein
LIKRDNDLENNNKNGKNGLRNRNKINGNDKITMKKVFVSSGN